MIRFSLPAGVMPAPWIGRGGPEEMQPKEKAITGRGSGVAFF